MVINRHGVEISFLTAMSYMNDDSILDAVIQRCAPCSNQRLFSEYEEEYLRRFGVEWELSGSNPLCAW